jgi:hypothetical protein
VFILAIVLNRCDRAFDIEAAEGTPISASPMDSEFGRLAEMVFHMVSKEEKTEVTPGSGVVRISGLVRAAVCESGLGIVSMFRMASKTIKLLAGNPLKIITGTECIESESLAYPSMKIGENANEFRSVGRKTAEAP